jgi:hypothetical protein
MNMEFQKKVHSALPHIIAISTFTIISFLYFYPVFEGKVLRANDAMVSRITSREITDYREETGKEALWTNTMFSGMPAYLISTKYPGNLFKKLDTTLRIFKMPVSAIFITMAGFYLLLLIFGVDPWLAMIGALAYGLSSFLFQIIAAGHNTQAVALAYMAPVIGAIYYSYRRDALNGALLTALFLTLEMTANHPQITYYTMICILILIATEFIFSVREKQIMKFIKTSLILIIPVILAIGINFGSLYTTYEYGKYSIRGKSELAVEDKNQSSGLDRDYITQWSYGIGETMNLLIPNFKGGSSAPFSRDSETVRVLRQNNAASAANQVMKYWGPQMSTEGPHYLGAVTIFLFILGLILIRGREKWWLLIATILAIFLSWGKHFMPFTNLFIDYFPGYNKFRAVTMILVIAQFCVPLLGVLALKDILSDKISRKEIINGLKLATIITGSILFLILVFPGIAGSFLNEYENVYPDWLKSAMVIDRRGLLRADTLRSFILILLASGALLGFVYEKIRKSYLLAILGTLILLDLWTVDKRYLNADRFEKPASIQKIFTPSVADKVIIADNSYKRVLNLSASTFNDNTTTSYFHFSVGGYHGAKLKRYQELIDSTLFRECSLVGSTLENAKSVNELNPVLSMVKTLNMLNAKYIIYNPDAPPLKNPNALGNAWFVEKPVIVKDANEEITTFRDTDPKNEAVINQIFKEQIDKSLYPVAEKDSIWLTSYQPNELIYRSSAQNDNLALFSEIYYPAGWRCFIDGKQSDYFRANYVLRGMIVPAGEHEIKYSFEPDSYYIGNKVSLASSFVLILLLAGSIVWKLKKK